LEKLDDGYLGFRLIKIIDPPQPTAENQSSPIDIPVEGELVRHKGKIFRIAIKSKEIRELSELA
jgi:hypothetical protein